MPPFMPRQRKHKARQKAANQKYGGATSGDSNVLEITSISVKQREEKRRLLKELLRAEQPKISSKRQKRLDKYIVSIYAMYAGV